MNSNIIVVTGTSRGIGLEFVKQFLAEKSNFVYATCRSPQDSTALVELEKEFPNQLVIVSMDVSQQESICKAKQKIQEEIQKRNQQGMDVLINNAGISNKTSPIEKWDQTEWEDMQTVYNTNVIGVLTVIQQFFSLFKTTVVTKCIQIGSLMGSISHVSSSSSQLIGRLSYRTSKAALNMLVKVLSNDLNVQREKKIITIVFHPGHVATDMGNSGGRNAPVKPSQSIQGMLQVMDKLTEEDNGKFIQYDGTELPW